MLSSLLLFAYLNHHHRFVAQTLQALVTLLGFTLQTLREWLIPQVPRVFHRSHKHGMSSTAEVSDHQLHTPPPLITQTLTPSPSLQPSPRGTSARHCKRIRPARESKPRSRPAKELQADITQRLVLRVWWHGKEMQGMARGRTRGYA